MNERHRLIKNQLALMMCIISFIFNTADHKRLCTTSAAMASLSASAPTSCTTPQPAVVTTTPLHKQRPPTQTHFTQRPSFSPPVASILLVFSFFSSQHSLSFFLTIFFSFLTAHSIRASLECHCSKSFNFTILALIDVLNYELLQVVN